MGAGGEVALSDVWRMLEHCAPGFTREAKTHHGCIRYAGKTFPTLPLGAHGRRKTVCVQAGHVTSMAREFGIVDCATAFIEGP